MSANVNAQMTAEQVDKAEKQITEQAKRIEYYITEFSVELLANKMRNGDFTIPDYQREFTWEPERKWRFIESLLMNLPIPFLFFWEDQQTGKLEIVDGSQRLRTIADFISGDLTLGELDKLDEVSGFSIHDLPESRQRKIKNRSIRGIVLNEHADDQARFDLFDRINTGSKQANTAEIRRGALGGKFMDLVIELAADPEFKELTPMSEKDEKEREREELAVRFFAYGDGLEDYDEYVSSFLFAYSKKMNGEFEKNPSLAAEYRERFHNMVKFVASAFPYGFKRIAKGKASPRARFESIAVGSYLALKKKPGLKPDVVKVKAWVESDEFRKVTGAGSANVRAKLVNRLEFVRDKLLKS